MLPLIFNPPVIAHRGASAYAPENTMSAFVKAVQLGSKWVEFDVMQASCGEPVIFHDDKLDRTSSGKGYLANHPFIELEQLDAGLWFHPVFSGERILALRQLLPFLYENKINANIELKPLPKHEEALVLSVLQTIKESKPTHTSTILFSSFSIKALSLLRKLAPESLLGLLIHDWHVKWEKYCQTLECVSVHVNEKILTKQKAEQIKNMHKILLSYTVNDPYRAQELFAFGVDAVFSDFPDIIAKVNNLNSNAL